MVDLGRNSQDHKKKIGATFMDLSKAFSNFDYSLLIAKVSSYSFSADSLRFILSCLKNKKQKDVIENSCSSLEKIIAGTL